MDHAARTGRRAATGTTGTSRYAATQSAGTRCARCATGAEPIMRLF